MEMKLRHKIPVFSFGEKRNIQTSQPAVFGNRNILGGGKAMKVTLNVPRIPSGDESKRLGVSVLPVFGRRP
jgi:hypothetical protein